MLKNNTTCPARATLRAFTPERDIPIDIHTGSGNLLGTSEKSGLDKDRQQNQGLELGRRDTLRLATLAAALGAGLSVSLHVDDASAADEKGAAATQLQIKFYRQQQKGDALLVYTAVSPEEASKKLLEAPGLVQWKGYSREAVLGAGQMQFKVEQAKQSSPSAPQTPTWDIKQNEANDGSAPDALEWLDIDATLARRAPGAIPSNLEARVALHLSLFEQQLSALEPAPA